MTDTARLRMSPVVLFALAIAVQVAIIGGIALSAQQVSSTGTAAFLKIEPVDPRDPLRGDYMTFGFTDVSSITVYDYETPGAEAYEPGDIVYVPLQRRGKFWQYAQGSGVTKTLPAESDREMGLLYIRGTVKSAYESVDSETKLTVGYGIEEYFIEEGSGKDFPLTGEHSARVSIAENGSSVLEQIYVNGREWP